MNEIVVKVAQVESVEDTSDGLRIKARTQDDGTSGDIPYAFPLLPKTFQSVPKVGEAVMIINAKLGVNSSNRYYIGPILSQRQFTNYEPYKYGKGSSLSLLQNGTTTPLEKISNFAQTEGAFPNTNDIAMVGRKGEDIILKDGEIDLRCGIRSEAIKDGSLFGNVVFNKYSPSYIQMKYNRGKIATNNGFSDGVINIVSDKINLISHQDINNFNLTDNKELIKDSDLPQIMEKLHQLPYGDLLVDALNKIISAVLNHVHPYPGLPACKDSTVMQMAGINLDSILSTNVRIS